MLYHHRAIVGFYVVSASRVIHVVQHGVVVVEARTQLVFEAGLTSFPQKESGVSRFII